MKNNEAIAEIIEKSIALGIRDKVLQLAEQLMNQQEYLGIPIKNELDFFVLAFNSITLSENLSLTARATDELASQPEMIAACQNLVKFMNTMQNKTKLDTIIIVADNYSMILMHHIIMLLKMPYSPRIVVADKIDYIKNIEDDALIYIFGWHLTDNFEKLVVAATKNKKIAKYNTHGYLIIGNSNLINKVHITPLINLEDPEDLIDAYGFGRPDSEGRHSELFKIMR